MVNQRLDGTAQWARESKRKTLATCKAREEPRDDVVPPAGESRLCELSRNYSWILETEKHVTG